MPRQSRSSGKLFEVSDRCWDDDDTIVYCGRGFRQSGPILVRLPKQRFPSAATTARLHRDFVTASKLPGDAVMRPLAIERYGNAHALIFEDCGARPLEPTPPVDATTLHAMLGTALRAIDAFAAVHENGVVHTNLTARHLWRAPGESAIRVFDFSRAVTRAEEAPPLPAEYDGDLRYAAPELIRRGFAAADPRADYYAFGIILFRWLTGRLPFEAEDPAELAHAHFASLPPSPLAHAPHLPDAVAALVANLLAKSPHERYPSAAALRAGIGECLSAIGAEPVGGSVRPAHTIKISTEFYGRTDELATLVRAFDRVAAGAKELLLISGPPGIGKSTLSGALRDPVLSRRGCFVSGKFDQFSRNVPYAATVQAFQQLVAILLSEPERRVAEWRERLTAALGSGGRIIADVIPEIERIIGPQPVLPEPAPLEARNRFNQAFRDFLRALATADHPLCLFIDDLQWADAASLSLLDVLLRDKSIGHVMVVGAYRSTEVDPSHPVIEEAAALELAALRVTRIELSGLAANEINRLIADSLGCLAASCRDLAGHVARKTDGNPFFVGQLLQAFHDKRLISFDRGRDEWAWDMASINASGITGDIVELMRGKMALLAPEVCECLKTAACLGSMFNLQHLTRACGKPEPAVARDLAVAVEDGLVVVADGPVTTGQPYSFVHDRVQQAAYALIPPRKLERFRLQIGERLLAALSPDEIAGAPFDVVNNLNFGSRLMTTTSERRRLAQLNLAAGRAARGSLAYRDALNYLRLGIELLDPPAWIEDYRLAFDLHRECFECEYQAGNIADADSLFDTLVYRAVSTVEKVDVYYTKILLNTCAARYEEAVRIGIDALSLLKIRFPPRPAKRHLLLELAKAKLLTMRRPLDELAGLPPMAEPERVAATRILTGMSPVGYFVDPNITMLSALKILTASLRYGNAAQSSIGYTLYGLALISALKDIRTGHAFGRLGVDLSERYGDIGSRTKTAVIFAGFVGIWGEPIDRCIAMLRDAHALGLEAGDFQYANYALLQIVFLSFARGLPLDTIAAECARLAPFVRETTDVFAIESLDIWRQSVLALKGATRSGAHLASADYDETAAEARLRAAKNRTALGYFLIRKLHLTYLFGDYDAARRYGAEAENFVELLPGQVLLAEHSMYYGLTLAAVMRGTRWHRHSLARALARCKRRLSRWASVAPQNFEPMALLLEAEAASVEASGVDLLDAYDRAAASARAYRFPYIEALAAECAAAYCLRCGRIRIGQAYLLDAIEAYNSWGAAAKARQIEAEAAADGVLLPSARDLPDEPAASPKSARPAPGTLNLSAVYKTQQALAGEVELDSLLNKLMTVVLEVSGARRGALVLREAGRLMVYVVAGEAGVGPIVEPTPLDLSPYVSPPVVNYAVNAETDVVLGEALSDFRFNTCARLRARRSRSVLCTPILKQGEILGALYLENDLVPEAFQSDRVDLLRLVISEAAIAIENARIYSQLRQNNRLLQAAVRRADLLEQVKAHLEKFVPRSVQRLIDQNPNAPDLETRSKNISVVFLDVAGYSRISEQFDDSKIKYLIERYFSAYLEDIHRNGGDINHTAGDGLMMLFQDPESHATHAVDTALAIRTKTASINRELSGQFPSIVVNIGINSGPASVGSTKIESATGTLWVYTASGPMVNLAARIAAFSSDGAVLVSEATAVRLHDKFELTPLGPQLFKNISESVNIFRVENRVARGPPVMD